MRLNNTILPGHRLNLGKHDVSTRGDEARVMHASMLGEIEYGLEDTIQPIQGHSAIQSRPVIAYSQLAQAQKAAEG